VSPCLPRSLAPCRPASQAAPKRPSRLAALCLRLHDAVACNGRGLAVPASRHRGCAPASLSTWRPAADCAFDQTALRCGVRAESASQANSKANLQRRSALNGGSRSDTRRSCEQSKCLQSVLTEPSPGDGEGPDMAGSQWPWATASRMRTRRTGPGRRAALEKLDRRLRDEYRSSSFALKQPPHLIKPTATSKRPVRSLQADLCACPA
jgi:hypothetical protein